MGASAAAAFSALRASAAETLPDVPGMDLDERLNGMLDSLVNREDAFEVVLAIQQCRGELGLEPELEEEGRKQPRNAARKQARKKT